MGHKHGGGWKGGWGSATPHYWGAPVPWGYPIQYPASEVFVVDNNSGDRERALAYVMSLPKAQRAAAYTKLFGKPAPAAVLGDWPPYQYMNAGGMAIDWRERRSGGLSAPWTQPYEYRAADANALGDAGGIFEKKTLELPIPGRPEIAPYGSPLGDCGCGCNGAGGCQTMGDVDVMSLAKPVAIGVGIYLLYKHLAKKRRR